MTEPTIALAATRFAASLATRRFLDWRMQRRLRKAYEETAEATNERCEAQGHQPRSPVWDAAAKALGDVTATEHLGRRLRRGAFGAPDVADVSARSEAARTWRPRRGPVSSPRQRRVVYLGAEPLSVRRRMSESAVQPITRCGGTWRHAPG